MPAWLDECESYAASHGYRHELAHIHYVRAVCERMQGRLEAARNLLDGALTIFRQAGDFRCTTRTLLELAEHHRPGHPEAAASLLLQGLETAMPASGASLSARVLASLTTAAAAAGDLPLAARAPAGGWPSPASSPGPEAAAIIHRLQVLDGGDLSGPKPSLSSRRPRERRSNTAFVQCGGARLSHKLRI